MFLQIPFEKAPFNRCQCCKGNPPAGCERLGPIPCDNVGFQAACSESNHNGQERAVKAVVYFWLTTLRDGTAGKFGNTMHKNCEPAIAKLAANEL